MMAGISVIVGVRNGEAYLHEALDSIAAQNMSDLEVVIVDDGSQDRTAEIATAHNIRPRVINRSPSGVPASLNVGLEAADKNFVAFLDADDVWPRARLSDMLHAFESNPDAEIIYGQMMNTDALLVPKQAPFATRQLSCSLVRREVFAKVGGFRTDVTHSSTLDWMSRAVDMRICMARLDSIVLLRRIHTSNMGIRDVARGRRDLLRVVRDHHARTRNE